MTPVQFQPDQVRCGFIEGKEAFWAFGNPGIGRDILALAWAGVLARGVNLIMTSRDEQATQLSNPLARGGYSAATETLP